MHGARHEPGLDRPRRRPRALPRAVHPTRHRAAARRHRHHHRGGPGDRRRARLPGAGAPVVRARRPRHADRLRRREPGRRAMEELAAEGSLGREGGLSAERPVLVDRFLEDAVEVDVDAIRDATGDVDHRRGDGAHRGGRACTRATPRARSRRRRCRRRWSRASRRRPRALADALDVRGLLNVQYAVKDDELYVIEANPRASRTVPFVSKATGVPLAKVAVAGDGRRHARASCATKGLLRPPAAGGHVAVKEAVLPVQPLPRRRHRARSRDAQHRRGDGHRPHLRHGLRQEPDRGRQPHPPRGHRVPLARRPRQGGRRGGGPPLRRARLHARRHRRHRRGPRSERG